MSEITKLYENVGVEKIGIKRCSGIKQGICQHNCNECESFDYKYPPFTAEKQIELIKLLAKGEVKINNEDGEYEFSLFDTISDFNSFEESLANLTNRMWQSLTLEEKQQVKGILE